MAYAKYEPLYLTPGRFIYAGTGYTVTPDGMLYEEVLTVPGNELNGIFSGIGKLFKGVGKIVKKVASNPIVGIALTAASYGAFGPAFAASNALTIAKGVTGAASLVNTLENSSAQKKALNKQADQQAAAYAAQVAVIKKQAAANALAQQQAQQSAQGTAAAQAYAAYLARGNPAVQGANAPDVTSYSPYIKPALVGVGLLAFFLIMRRA